MRKPPKQTAKHVAKYLRVLNSKLGRRDLTTELAFVVKSFNSLPTKRRREIIAEIQNEDLTVHAKGGAALLELLTTAEDGKFLAFARKAVKVPTLSGWIIGEENNGLGQRIVFFGAYFYWILVRGHKTKLPRVHIP